MRDGGRRCVDAAAAAGPARIAGRERSRRALASSRLTRPQAAWPAPRNDLRRVADDAWERFEVSRPPCDRTGAGNTRRDRGARRGRPAAPRAGVRTTSGPGRGRRFDGRRRAMAAASPGRKRRSPSTWRPTPSFPSRASRASNQVSTQTARTTSSTARAAGKVGPVLRAVFADEAVRKVFHSCEGVDIPRLDRVRGPRLFPRHRRDILRRAAVRARDRDPSGELRDTQIAAAALELPLGLVDLLGACAVVDGAGGARGGATKPALPEL